ncbi:DUF4382 domain-containing protein [Ferruginibacter albus]|uniref:DUF4382 domain-containing protein n=1 Tax=Ferruginibacter albus TaxID=2875540 RepID=UPI001CC75B6E|nr:DUF4382 domain-containing protein [Ferruginibacter albus]UAY51430.1 DUF4382 domain-containing protein [Ferruginibacter albus]
MKKTAKVASLLAIVLSLVLIFFSCSKDASLSESLTPGTQNASIYMTDAPGFFDNVMIDIRSVQVLVDTCKHDNGWGWGDDDHHGNDDHNNGSDDHCPVWDTLNITPGVYDLLSLRNGTDTLLAGGNLPDGKIVKIKIELGTNNSLVKDGVTYPLNLPTNQPSFIVVNLRGDEWDEFKPKHVRLWLDFDVQRSIVVVRNNEFFLSPFIKVFTIKTTGSINGRVTPVKDAFPVITISNSTDTAYALPNPGGEFKVRGLTAGSYSVFINSSNGYSDTTITNVNVTAGGNVALGNIKLHK